MRKEEIKIGGALKLRRVRLYMVSLALFVIASIWLLTYVIGPLDTVPRNRISTESPDQVLTVQVVKKRVSLCPLRVALIARIYDDKDSLIFEKQIFEDGWWNEDVGEMYSKVVFVGDEILIGPGFSPDEYFIIKKSDLRLLTRPEY